MTDFRHFPVEISYNWFTVPNKINALATFPSAISYYLCNFEEESAIYLSRKKEPINAIQKTLFHVQSSLKCSQRTVNRVFRHTYFEIHRQQ